MKKIAGIVLKIFYLTMVLILTGCGFHLRAEYPVSTRLNNMYVEAQNPYSEFILSLKQTLKSNKVHLAENPKAANYILKIDSVKFTHSWANAYSSAQANVYTLFMTVVFKVIDSTGKDILPLKTIRVTRSLTLNPNEVLTTSNQVETNEQEMGEELIEKILYILSSKQIYAHLS